MAQPDEQLDERDFVARGGDDSPPLMAKVSDPPPVHWGALTSTPRTLSPAYIRFLYGAREARDGK
jgi:hypothetical protein